MLGGRAVRADAEACTEGDWLELPQPLTRAKSDSGTRMTASDS